MEAITAAVLTEFFNIFFFSMSSGCSLVHWSSQLFLWCELVAGTRADPAYIEKKKMLKTSVSTAAVMASIATQEVIDIAKGHAKWTYDVYFSILMQRAIDDDRAKNRVAKGTMTTAQLNKAKQLANATSVDGGRGRGHGHDGRSRG